MWKSGYAAFSAYHEENSQDLSEPMGLDLMSPCMILGIGILASGLVCLLRYANGHTEDGAVVDDPELDRAELQLELDSFAKGQVTDEEETSSRSLVQGALIGSFLGAAASPALWIVSGGELTVDFGLAVGSIGSLLGVLYKELRPRMSLGNHFHHILGLARFYLCCEPVIGFASNSLYHLGRLNSTLLSLNVWSGYRSLFPSIREHSDRALGVYHSVAFVILGWVASFSKLCREEQMPYCRSTYYSSATSSTSAPWQLLIPFIISISIPSIIKSYYTSSRSYEGFAPIWIGWIFRIGLVLSAIFWTLDAADDGIGSQTFLQEPSSQSVSL